VANRITLLCFERSNEASSGHDLIWLVALIGFGRNFGKDYEIVKSSALTAFNSRIKIMAN
jgi:hypothetical protein